MIQECPAGWLTRPLAGREQRRWTGFVNTLQVVFWIVLLPGSTDANLVFGRHDKALLPGLNIFCLKETVDTPHERIATGIPQAHEEKAVVGTWYEPANVRKV